MQATTEGDKTLHNQDLNPVISVIFVDDEKRILSALQRLTVDEEFAIITASSGEEALEFLKCTPNVGLIVSDLRMPGQTGIELLEKVRILSPDTLRILLTSYSSTPSAIAAINKGEVYRFITKPWDDEELILILREAVERYRLASENSRLAELVKQQHGELKEWNTRLEQRVREQTEQFRVLFDGIPDPLLLLSPELKVNWGNRSASEVFKLEPSNLVGKKCKELWIESDMCCTNCNAIQSFQTGQVFNSNLKSSDGRIWDARFFPVIDDLGVVKNVIAMYIDITEKEARQAEILRAGQLASLGELAAGVAHEINNPINGVINYAQILHNRSDAQSQENDITRRIIKEGERIAGIVRGLLSFARERQENMTLVPLQEILSETLPLVESQLGKSGIRLILDVDSELPPVVALKQQIQQVFLNLISNARYALDNKYPGNNDQKTLIIRGESCTLAEEPGVRVIFHDQGIGIPEDIIEKVMNPFFSTKPHDKGTGLGLSISHGIITDHGGRLTIDSDFGKFTRVSVELRTRQTQGDDK